LSIERIPRPDRTAILTLLEDPRTGIFSLLDEVSRCHPCTLTYKECVLPGGSAKAFTRKIFTVHAGHPLLAKPRLGQAGRRLLDDEVALP
jgi:hypothetical protein